MTLTFARSRHTGKWCVLGPLSDLAPGAVVEVTRTDGTTILKRVTSVSKPFQHESGVPWAFGFVPRNDTCPRCRDAEIPRDGESDMCPVCALVDLGML